LNNYITYHTNLTLEHWRQFSLIEQLANIGAEVSRALAWKKKGDKEKSERALERGLELFALTVQDRRWQHRLKEILRTREIVLDYFWGENEFQSTPEAIDKYFFQFAVAARRQK
jgi:hypothetical protein